jgi:hypothetical protein
MPKLRPPLARTQHARAAGEAVSEPWATRPLPSSNGIDDATLPLSRGCCAETADGAGSLRTPAPAAFVVESVAMAPRRWSQIAVGAVWSLWSFRRLCVAVIRRHSERQAALPQVHLLDRRQHKPREVILRQPLAQARWHQQHLLPITRQEVLSHAEMLLIAPDGTPYLTARK